jgi:hypothetical protein
MLAMDGQPGAQAPANPGKTTLLLGLVAIKAMEGFDRNLGSDILGKIHPPGLRQQGFHAGLDVGIG